MSNTLKEIKDALIKRKENFLKQGLKDVEGGRLIEPISMDALEKEEKNEFKIKTGTLIDEIIGGGVPEGKSMMLYGEYGSAKTQTCETTAVLCPDIVVYIDTEKSLRMKRLKEICDSRELDWEVIKKKIIYFRVSNWIEQLLVLFSLPAPTDMGTKNFPEGKVGLIICDSISKRFRGVEFLGRENLAVKNGLIREFILSLENFADMHKAALIYTTQIYDTVSGSPMAGPVQTQKAIGGRSAEHQPDIVLHFRKGKGNIRVARMVDSSWNALAERSFVINEKGIDIIPESTTASSTEDKRAKKFDKTQEQEAITSRKKTQEDEEAGE